MAYKSCASAVLMAAGFGIAAPAMAQQASMQDLQSALEQRDQVIADLKKRIETLEARNASPPPIAKSAIPAAAALSPDAKPGSDDLALEALSRGLIQRGALLLPSGGLEVTASAAYRLTQNQGLVLVDTPEGISTVADQRQRRDTLELGASVRVGLPWRSQLQVSVPFAWRRETSALGDGTDIRHHAADIGDLEVELSHQFLAEHGAMPALIGAVSWRFPTGGDPFRASVTSVASGGGTHQAIARVTALKTVDPLVLFTSLSYAANLSRQERFGRVHPGNSINWQLGTLLAVSPETSLNFGFSQQFRSRTNVDGVPIPGSDGVAAMALFGVDQALSSRFLLDVSLGVGVTRDAPDYQLMFSLPIRLR